MFKVSINKPDFMHLSDDELDVFFDKLNPKVNVLC